MTHLINSRMNPTKEFLTQSIWDGTGYTPASPSNFATDSFDLSAWSNFCVTVDFGSITNGCELALQVSNDGSTWYPFSTSQYAQNLGNCNYTPNIVLNSTLTNKVYMLNEPQGNQRVFPVVFKYVRVIMVTGTININDVHVHVSR